MTEQLDSYEVFDDPLLLHEPDEPDSVQVDWSPKRLNALAEYWVAKYGGEGVNFTKEQERLLATHVQEGLAAQEQVLGDVCKDTRGAARKIRLGLRAERALVENNLRFAFMYARESVGIVHRGTRDRFIQGQQASEEGCGNEEPIEPKKRAWKPGRPQRALGTYKPLSSMKSPRASLEDRYNMAAIGLLNAARKFEPDRVRNGTFISFAAWYIQSTLDRERYASEHTGARLPAHMADKLNVYFKNNPSVSIDHKVPDDIEPLLRTSEPLPYPDNFGELSEGSLEELNDPWGEDDRPEGLAEVVDDPDDSFDFEIGHSFAARSLSEALQTLSDREAEVIILRYGLGKCACHQEVEGFEGMHTLDEIGMVIGVTRERVRQIESKSMAKLRHPMRSVPLRGSHDYLIEADALPATTVWRGDAIRLVDGQSTHAPDPEYPQDLSAVPPVIDEAKFSAWKERQDWLRHQATRDKKWQAYADEPWEMPLRETPHRASPEQAQAVLDILRDMPKFYFSKKYDEVTQSPYPVQPMVRIESALGKGLLGAEQITSLWNTFMAEAYPELAEALEDDFQPDKIGQLFSRIIAENINDNDEAVRLVIPRHASGRIGFLASNLGLGRVEIIGTAGPFVGAWNRGYADVQVRGDAGDSAGVLMKGNARLVITGDAGYQFGLGADEEAELYARRAKSVGQHGENVLLKLESE